MGGGEEAATKIGQVLAGQWSLATALALLAWYVFAPQCASTLAVIKRETGGWRWMWATFGYMLALAYVAAFATYHVAVALGAGGRWGPVGHGDFLRVATTPPQAA